MRYRGRSLVGITDAEQRRKVSRSFFAFKDDTRRRFSECKVLVCDEEDGFYRSIWGLRMPGS